ncbi:MAG TPA: mycothione reductase [Acidimicrobiia bacterium]|jgi:mycothione reductase|nr:mycothione reductase [Acidimicrobiia bacterium]HIL45644.1 mycothione reductase [Acidimicrobiia bacterium]
MPHHDLLIIGAGSGNSVTGGDHRHWDVAIAEPWVFGGTCLNRGCIPSKMFVHTADRAYQAQNSAGFGLKTSFDGADWPAIRDRVFGRIDPIAESGLAYRESLANTTVYPHSARFIGERTVEINGQTVTAERIVLAAGARPVIPEVPGLAESPYVTSDSVMRLDELPRHLVILGGGFIAVEMAHVFAALGSKVTMVNRSHHLLREMDTAISERITEIYGQRMDLVMGVTVDAVRHEKDFTLDLSDGSTLVADQLLVATGRQPNSDTLDVTAGGITVNERGHVLTDEHLQTVVPNVWALGDITNPVQLKHLANADAKVVLHNLTYPEDLHSVDRSLAPYAVFGHPQIATIGANQRDLDAQGLPYLVAQRDYADTAYGWAMEDTAGFVKLLADPKTRLLLGAHLIGPHAPTLIQQLIQGMAFGQTVDQMARGQFYIHPAMPEVVEQALLEF